jgi:hypothetical protein
LLCASYRLRSACGYALANKSHALERSRDGWHRSNTSTAVYTSLAPNRFKEFWRDRVRFKFPIAIRCCRSAVLKWTRLSVELRLGESIEKFSVAVVATDDGRFAYQIFLVCGEPRTLLTDSACYLTPDDAAQAGYETVASMSETPLRRPYAPTHRAIVDPG